MKRLSLLLLFLALVLSACNNPSDPYAAKVDGVTISAAEVDDDLDAIIANKDTRDAIDAQLTQTGGLKSGGPNTFNATYSTTILTSYIRSVLFEHEVDKLGLQVTPEKLAETEKSLRSNQGQSDALDAFPASYRDKLIAQEARTDVLLADRTTPEKIRAYYEQNKAQFAQACVRHILVDSEGAAQAVRQRVVAGEDFAAVSNELATQQGGQPNGGELGCYSDEELSRLVKPFADAVRVLPPGELSQPVQTQFGFHIVQVKSRSQLQLEEATPQIKQKLGDPNQLLADVFSKAKIEVNPRYGDYVKGDPVTGQPGQVVPHQNNALELEQPQSDTPGTEGFFGGQDVPQ